MKKITDNGLLEIRINSNNEMDVVFQPINNTVWMDRNGLCRLFGCYMKEIDQCLGDIFEKDMLRIEDTCKYHVIAGGRRVGYDIRAVNLTVIITMAFRLDTPQAWTIRIWCVEQIAKMKSLDVLFTGIGQDFRLN